MRVLVILAVLELIVRIEPARSWLHDTLDPYANLLWYTDYMPSYEDQLLNGPHHNFWLVGSSYMMTSLNPERIQQIAHSRGFADLTFQNFGMSGMRNLTDMAEVYDHWMFQLDQPRYILMAVSINNFAGESYGPSVARQSPMESVFIFPDSLDDYITGFLYNNSRLFRYAVIARNATFIPLEKALLKPRPLGGYLDDPLEFGACDPSLWVTNDNPKLQYSPDHFVLMDEFIHVIQAHHIPLIIVNIPFNFCGLRQFFASYENYENAYLIPLANHLRDMGIHFLPLDTQFYAEVPKALQYQYYEDISHPNRKGAALISQWTAEFIASWLDQIKNG